MQTHRDSDQYRKAWISELEKKAKEMVAAKESQIASGFEGEHPLAEWKQDGMGVRHMPDDEHGVLRISVGGGNETPVRCDYCVIRGGVGQCIELLQRAITALKAAP